MAVENATWGYTRIQGALKNLGHGVGRSTIARILKEQSIPPSGRRPMAWRTFIAAHWPALLAADFLTSLAGTLQRLGHPLHGFAPRAADTAYGLHLVMAAGQRLSASGDAGVDVVHGALRSGGGIRARHSTWRVGVDRLLEPAGVHVVRTVGCTPSSHGYTGRFVWLMQPKD